MDSETLLGSVHYLTSDQAAFIVEQGPDPGDEFAVKKFTAQFDRAFGLSGGTSWKTMRRWLQVSKGEKGEKAGRRKQEGLKGQQPVIATVKFLEPAK